jgi:hypothetical protein
MAKLAQRAIAARQTKLTAASSHLKGLMSHLKASTLRDSLKPETLCSMTLLEKMHVT